MLIPTSAGNLSAEQVIDALNFSFYRYNRDLGVSAESLGRYFDRTGAAMEAKYQAEKAETA